MTRDGPTDPSTLTRREALAGLAVLPLLAPRAGPPASIRLQPHPLKTVVCRIDAGPTVVTAVQRTWAPGDAARCRLCDRCCAEDDQCLWQVIGHVPTESAPLFSTAGLPRRTPARRDD